ncbi:putative protein, LmbE-like protein [Polynucleobacter duraquae]|uniref:GlcNAc-PI de-N-acetylase n=1 Tax=Polynucleobacter duraquae TaxID=1835254 RepID=A0A0E3ZL34_9BURK|nr:PIG-L family deacetylase [Polynucleobacter duraquae]AKD24681.1 putative protein, LmbE-like protein [Polynucleobacter duraquae]
MATALFLFAHQDDECGVFQAIDSELNSGSTVHCCYFTSGTPSGLDSSRRDLESQKVLASLGIDPKNMHFIGGLQSIPDGNLVANVNFAYEWILSFLKSNGNVINIYLPAWEGGHPDHDVLHAVGVRAANNANFIDTTFQYPLYNGYHCFGPFFRTLLPLIQNGDVRTTNIHIFNRLRFLGLCLRYPSQVKTWIGLFPFFLLHYFFWGTQDLQKVSLDRLRQKPHAGSLYYERRKFSSWEKISSELIFFEKNYLFL